MSHPQLDNLVRIGQLKAEPPADAEIQGLLRAFLREGTKGSSIILTAMILFCLS